MKKIILTTLLLFSCAAFSFAQKYAYVDTQYILDQIMEYKNAQDQLNDISVTWQKEVEAKFAEIDQLYKSFQSESILLPEDMKKQKEEDIIKKEKEAKDLQKKRFGKDGDLFKKRQELVKPIQDKVFNAVEEVAQKKNYSFVFDKSGSISILYADPKLDISDEVLSNISGVTKTKDK
ncbi:MAG: OmpH family outer membrane protein [Bacteroidales bacterium]